MQTLEDADERLAEEWAEQMKADKVRKTFSGRYGRGWQRRLAKNLGIGESTLSEWLRDDRIPTWAALAMGAFLIRGDDAVAEWRVVESTDDTHAVFSFDGPVGRRVADGITSVEDARLIAAAPALYEACQEARGPISDLTEGEFGYQDRRHLEKIEAALELARPPERPESGSGKEAEA